MAAILQTIFQMQFPGWKLFYFDSNFFDIYIPKGPIYHKASIGSDKGLALSRESHYLNQSWLSNRMAWQWAETLVEIRGTLVDIRGTTK